MERFRSLKVNQHNVDLNDYEDYIEENFCDFETIELDLDSNKGTYSESFYSPEDALDWLNYMLG
jgi:hypothetical protein